MILGKLYSLTGYSRRDIYREEKKKSSSHSSPDLLRGAYVPGARRQANLKIRSSGDVRRMLVLGGNPRGLADARRDEERNRVDRADNGPPFPRSRQRATCPAR